MDSHKLHEHIFGTYISLRYGIAALAFLYPILLYAVGRFVYGIELENTLSHYYFSLAADDPTMRIFPMRAWFVGLLFSIGVLLYLYKGFTVKENIALNIAGLSAVIVALVPMDYECWPNCGSINLHGVSAVILFLSIAYVSLVCTKSTLTYLNDKQLEASFLKKYRMLGALLVASPVVALIITFFTQDMEKYVFFVELAGIWAFALYWLLKSQEMSISNAERIVLMGKHNANIRAKRGMESRNL